MFRRPMTRLALAAAAAGTICALGASVAYAAPSATWSGPKGPVPGAITNDTPAISSITFPGPGGTGLIVGWRQRAVAGHIFYKYKAPGINKGKWSAKFELPGSTAITSSPPVFRSYIDPYGKDAILAMWTGHADHHIWYEQGETLSNGTITWTKATIIPTHVLYTDTSNAPAVQFTNVAYRVVVSWRGPANHVRFSVGTPSHRGFSWSNSAIVPGAPVTKGCKGAPCTADTPALAEVQSNATTGTLYFFWRQHSTSEILYSTTPDTAANLVKPVFTGPAQVPGAATIEGPAASDSTLTGFGPLLLVYKSPGSTTVRFQTLTGTIWTTPVVIPTVRTAVSPALYQDVLATTKPSADGTIVLHVYS
ncbi:MAG TPA: hypothetical protein VMA95_06535 [Streptosporangiaceae bacterium]|nr:hypothetical protein [Streptosporangiaceae bacterium]